MFRDYMNALFKRVDTRKLMQFKPPALPARIYAKQMKVNKAHYKAFCEEVAWTHASQIHPLYLQMLSLPLQMQCLLDKNSPFPLLGLIHCANKIKIVGLCDIDHPFEYRVKFSEVRAHNRGWEVDLSLQAFQFGQCVYQAISSYLVKVKAVHVAPRITQEEVHSEFTESPKTQLATIEVNADTGRRYAKISGDYNPIHLFALTARLFGFKRPIAHGMWTLARTISLVPIQQAQAITEVNCRFKRPVFLPSQINVFQMGINEQQTKLDVTDIDGVYEHLIADVKLSQ